VSLAAEFVAATRDALEPHRNPERAVPMAAYMKHHFEFLGIPMPERRRLVKAATRRLPRPTEPDLHEIARECWALPEREYQYGAVDLLAQHIGCCTAETTLPVIEELITTKSWWDTVDGLCRSSAGELVRRAPAARAEMDRWSASDDRWLIRSAILHQEAWRDEMDFAWISATCTAHAQHPDFFVRKAIGWVLRSYARRSTTNADDVRRLLGRAPFSGLTRREALKRVVH
jgi:3-methyladenine DNA glycosylase AlkD